ncbi:acyl--CoA ligase [Paenibacillus hexagrammi]|uniref:Acyl--CoA ligase n=1 Tax=Paenibacillus hexagrammi TaxID=2908839 RepID=A0ABY3SD73_9BACL|nr:acyl--CoA ligase [Paenibacillus sp. YPD9-1]
MHQLALDKSSYTLQQLRLVALMGEYLHLTVAQRIQARFPHTACYMNYGQTEASPRITFLPAAYFTVKEGCIGLPLPSLDVCIAGADGENVRDGEVGELW